jgi:hypothetical protein
VIPDHKVKYFFGAMTSEIRPLHRLRIMGYKLPVTEHNIPEEQNSVIHKTKPTEGTSLCIQLV